MYRRNIKHIIAPLAVLIGIFIFYQAWLKPNYFHETPPLPAEVILEDMPSGSLVPAPHQGDVPAEMKLPRTIDPISIPVPKHSELLSAIHEELEKRHAALAKTKLE